MQRGEVGGKGRLGGQVLEGNLGRSSVADF